MRRTTLPRLQEISRILNHAQSEHSFNRMYEVLLKEIMIESGKATPTDGHYLSDLVQTRDKQAADYIAVKKKYSKKQRMEAFRGFINHFQQNVESEIRRLNAVLE